MNQLLSFEVQVYGTHPPSPSHSCPGVIQAYVAKGTSAQEVANQEAAKWSGSQRAGSVGVWAVDRKSGHAFTRI